MRILDVPYISQWDANASYSVNDCIPTSVAMILAYFNNGKVSLTPDQITRRIGTKGLINFNQTQSALRHFGHEIRFSTRQNLNNLRSFIDQGRPFIALVTYGDLPNRQDTYRGGHAVVVTGYDAKNIYVNDPNFWGARRAEGRNKAYPIEAFNRSWQSTATGNLPGNLWFFDMKPSKKHPEYMRFDDDIPSDVEDMFGFKKKAWYNKYWTGKQLINYLLDIHDKYDELRRKK